MLQKPDDIDGPGLELPVKKVCLQQTEIETDTEMFKMLSGRRIAAMEGVRGNQQYVPLFYMPFFQIYGQVAGPGKDSDNLEFFMIVLMDGQGGVLPGWLCGGVDGYGKPVVMLLEKVV